VENIGKIFLAFSFCLLALGQFSVVEAADKKGESTEELTIVTLSLTGIT